MQVKWTEPAAKALERIQDYIAKDNPRAAFEVVQEIRLAVSRLEEYPKIGRRGRVIGTRELVTHSVSYIVPYRIQKQTIQILSIYHTSRKWPDTFE
ncbi:hypothetical protein MNBD_NITROSPIRAE01-1900 [hydrothermal vent metagenome]|uniref:Death on curing protein, Doc toxin n=1 Tax=hydrothermal vent metagenome TaxID=652676 RepID=A0A3B1CU40_9ZZZZ